MEITNKILKSIQTVVDERIKKAGFNKTRIGKIVSSGNNNTYNVIIDGREYKNIPCYGGGIFNIGDIARVYIPNNQFNQMYLLNYSNLPINSLLFINSTQNPNGAIQGIWELQDITLSDSNGQSLPNIKIWERIS